MANLPRRSANGKETTEAMIKRVKREVKKKTGVADFDPIIMLVFLGLDLVERENGDRIFLDASEKISVFKEVAQYWYPKKRAIEIAANNEENYRNRDTVPMEHLQSMVIRGMRAGKLDNELGARIDALLPVPDSKKH